MTIHINSPDKDKIHLKPIITVFGVGGAGGNAINNMITSKLEGVRFIAANTDAQALAESLAEKKIQLGHKLTQGLGAGSKSEIGAEAAEESIAEIERHITDSHMVFITAGMGGGTGTGAASIIAKAAKDKGILTIGVITKPFHFEGKHRMKVAEAGVIELRKHVDTLITIPNQNLFKISDEKTTFSNAFKLADKVLYSGIQGITDLIVMPGLINLDFADIKVVMSEMGHAVLGTGEAEGENRALRAAEAAIYNPLLAYSSISGAKGVLVNITGGDDITLFEVDEAVNRVRQEVNNEETNVIFGSTFNENLTGKIRVSIVATGVDSKPLRSNLILQNKKNDETASKDLMSKKIDPLPQTMEKDPENINWLKKFMNKIASDLEMKKILPTKTNETAPVNSPSKASLDESIYKVPAFIRRKSKEINE